LWIDAICTQEYADVTVLNKTYGTNPVLRRH
jgi:hypothetical protein